MHESIAKYKKSISWKNTWYDRKAQGSNELNINNGFNAMVKTFIFCGNILFTVLKLIFVPTEYML